MNAEHAKIGKDDRIPTIAELDDRTKRRGLISIILASNRPKTLSAFLRNLQQTCRDVNNFEVLIHVDAGNDELNNIVKILGETKKMNVRFFNLDVPHSYFSLNISYDHILKHVSENSQFVCILADTFRFLSPYWDHFVLSHSDLFQDNVYALRISNHRYVTHRDLNSAWHHCENWGMYSTKWIELAGGWGEFWCPDAWQEFINYFLKHYADPDSTRHFRSVPLAHVTMMKVAAEPDEYVTQGNLQAHRFNFTKWYRGEMFLRDRMLSKRAMRNFLVIAARMSLHIRAYEIGLKTFDIKDNPSKQELVLSDLETFETKSVASYKLARKIVWREQFIVARRQPALTVVWLLRHLPFTRWLVPFALRRIFKLDKSMAVELAQY